MSNTNKVALVTGVGRRDGLGFEVCRQLARHGFEVVLSARTEAQASTLAAALHAEGSDVASLALDITDAASRMAAAERLRTRHGRLDVLINNAAGLGRMGERVETANLSDALAALQTTLLGTWGVIQATLPLLRGSPSARIVNVSSGAGSHADAVFGLRTANAMGPSYACAKSALNALTAALAQELSGTKILVNAVCPGFTATFPGAESMGARPVSLGAASIVWAALIPDSGPSGGFFRDGEVLSW